MKKRPQLRTVYEYAIEDAFLVDGKMSNGLLKVKQGLNQIDIANRLTGLFSRLMAIKKTQMTNTFAVAMCVVGITSVVGIFTDKKRE